MVSIDRGATKGLISGLWAGRGGSSSQPPIRTQTESCCELVNDAAHSLETALVLWDMKQHLLKREREREKHEANGFFMLLGGFWHVTASTTEAVTRAKCQPWHQWEAWSSCLSVCLWALTPPTWKYQMNSNTVQAKSSQSQFNAHKSGFKESLSPLSSYLKYLLSSIKRLLEKKLFQCCFVRVSQGHCYYLQKLAKSKEKIILQPFVEEVQKPTINYLVMAKKTTVVLAPPASLRPHPQPRPLAITITTSLSPPSQLTVPLAHLQQDGLFQHDGERLVLLVLLVVDDLHI